METTLKTQLSKLGLDTYKGNLNLNWKQCVNLGAWHDIVCIDSGKVFSFIEPYHDSEGGFYASNIESETAYFDNSTIVTE